MTTNTAFPEKYSLSEIAAEPAFRRVDGVSIRFVESPHSDLQLIDSGHFVWEDTADPYAVLVTSWWPESAKRR